MSEDQAVGNYFFVSRIPGCEEEMAFTAMAEFVRYAFLTLMYLLFILQSIR
jgi:hypothetical protein